MKKTISAVVCVMYIATSFAQNVFTYGKYAVTKDEFEKAFYKNPASNAGRKKALREYLDLYINFKLKVRAAYDAGLDKDPTQQYELQNFKKQLADNIINDEANVKGLVKEAFERGRKEIHVQQVFIEVPENADTADAFKRVQAAFRQLKEGKDFASIAQQFSTDEATKQSKGDLGFVTVFTLPYELESVLYSLKPNAFSLPVKTKAGYHIFKNAGERSSSGSRRVAQILIAIPPAATDDERVAASQKADSVYSLLKSGGNFASLASALSNDLSSSHTGGELPEFTIGTYSPEFENVAFSLKTSGEISKPFQTAYGYHILKLIEAKTAPADINDPVVFASLQEKVLKDNRLELSKKELIQNKLALIKYKPPHLKTDDLFNYTDSALKRDKAVVKSLNANTALFSFGTETMKAGDWVRFVKASSNSGYLSSKNGYKELYKSYVAAAADEYYHKHLEAYNDDYRQQVKEFKEANLLFGIMERRVWGKANTDTVGLLQHYSQHKPKYMWPASADAIIVSCSDEVKAVDLQRKLKNTLSNWRTIMSDVGPEVTADSGRFEQAQLAIADKSNLKAGVVTAPVKNQNDTMFTITAVIKVYDEPAQRSFEDARGLVISDYQQVLEDKWIADLKRKYPVKINEAVFQSIK